MCSRRTAKITASLLLVVGNAFVLGFFGFLIFYTVLLAPILRSLAGLAVLQGGGAVLLVPQYLMVVSYKVGSIFGLLQIHMNKRRWIDVVKLFADLVFLLSAGATVLILVFAFTVVLTAGNVLLLIPGIDLIVVAFVIGCYFSSMLVWKCSQEEEPTHQTNISNNEEGFELTEMSKQIPT